MRQKVPNIYNPLNYSSMLGYTAELSRMGVRLDEPRSSHIWLTIVAKSAHCIYR